ncbi:MAG: thiamine diphosphokinase [Holosporaceae bacterium]|jgi:thiamine pyrophosphokinase|nr:thiamine diphosphokinase [Holosporaceae bacterium]
MTKILEKLLQYRSAICLDGHIECDVLREICLPIIAADGAANTLIKNGIEPTVIIGDLDSVDNGLLKNRRHIRNESQESTDFEKALDYIEEKSLSPAIVFGIDGGYIDRVLGNISIFTNTKFVAVSKDMIFMMVDDNQILNLEVNTKLSIFGMPRCIIKSSGLKWELNGDELFICGKNSHSNRAASDRVELKISSGKALIFIYTKTISDAGVSNCLDGSNISAIK